MRTKIIKTAQNVLYAVPVPVLAVVFALLLGSIIIAAMGINPMAAYKFLLQGSIGSIDAFYETVVKMTPLILSGLSFAIAKRCGMINIGAEGQLFMGGLCAGMVAIYVKGLPMGLHMPLAVLAGLIGGGLWGLLAGYLNVQFGASEVICTVMLNYVARYFVSFMVSGPIIAPPGNVPQSEPIPETAKLFRLFETSRINVGVLIAIACLVLYYLFLWKTTLGFELRVVGMNREAARYAGMKPRRNTLTSMFLAGGFAGLAGVCVILGMQTRVIQNFSSNYGFDGIAVALLGQNSPVGIFFAAVLFGVLKSGSNMMQLGAQVPVSLANIIQGLVIFFVAGSGLYNILKRKYDIKRSVKE